MYHTLIQNYVNITNFYVSHIKYPKIFYYKRTKVSKPQRPIYTVK